MYVGDTAYSLGTAMDELMRHQPTLKPDAMKAIVKVRGGSSLIEQCGGVHPSHALKQVMSNIIHYENLETILGCACLMATRGCHTSYTPHH